jgi:hypothetical protein
VPPNIQVSAVLPEVAPASFVLPSKNPLIDRPISASFFGCSDVGELIRYGTEAAIETLELAPGLFID